jgi:quinoprotein glucose dehydrogenase
VLVSTRTVNVQGLPIVKPPWGRITAYDLNKGEIAWQIAHGETPDNVRNHRALQGLTIPRTGGPPGLLAGTLVTKTLLVSGDPHLTTTGGTRGSWLRAYNKATGAEVGTLPLPAPQTGGPMTYMLNGRQYLVVSIGTTGHGAEIVAFAVPSGTPAAAPVAAGEN